MNATMNTQLYSPAKSVKNPSGTRARNSGTPPTSPNASGMTMMTAAKRMMNCSTSVTTTARRPPSETYIMQNTPSIRMLDESGIPAATSLILAIG